MGRVHIQVTFLSRQFEEFTIDEGGDWRITKREGVEVLIIRRKGGLPRKYIPLCNVAEIDVFRVECSC